MVAETYGAVAVTLGLVVTRPRIAKGFRVTPAMAALAGVAVLAAFGSVRFGDLAWAAHTMWRPLLGIVAIMVMTGVARRTGVLEGAADLVFRRAGGDPKKLFGLVFVFGALTAAILNNDSAVLLLTPLVVVAARKRHPKLVVPLAFAVFLSAGVAPVIVSNPMNMVVATFAGIGFNEYAARMIVPSVAGSLVTFIALRLLFRKDLASPPVPVPVPVPASVLPVAAGRRVVVAALLAVVLAYPLVSWLGGPVWIVAVCGALLLVALGARSGHRPLTVLREEVHADVLVFLVAVLVLSLGLRNVGVVDHLSRAYAGASPMRIGVLSAMGSAILNNHPMANLNMLALVPGGSPADPRCVLAALVGGDLGPRLFPMGSLAGLLWLEMLRRAGVQVSVRRFVLVGVVATLPALGVCLTLL
ncbi:MAG: arsenical pump rane protein [Labilithrix sp.]|nr:arsenical pump rane protein [Labilithrix sp.]